MNREAILNEIRKLYALLTPEEIADVFGQKKTAPGWHPDAVDVDTHTDTQD